MVIMRTFAAQFYYLSIEIVITTSKLNHYECQIRHCANEFMD
jgi:hypothetical protein